MNSVQLQAGIYCKIFSLYCYVLNEFWKIYGVNLFQFVYNFNEFS